MHGVSTRAVDDLVRAMCMSGISKSHVSRQCEELDDKVKAFLARPVEGDWIDATYVKVRQNGRSVSVAVIVAVGVNSDGRREVLGMDIGPSEGETFWTAFLRKLARRGLRSVKLVVSDAHEATRPPSPRCFTQPGSAAVFIPLRNVLAHAGRQGRRVVSASIATAFAHDDAGRRQNSVAQDRRPIATQAAQARQLSGRGGSGRARLHDVPAATPRPTALH